MLLTTIISLTLTVSLVLLSLSLFLSLNCAPFGALWPPSCFFIHTVAHVRTALELERVSLWRTWLINFQSIFRLFLILKSFLLLPVYFKYDTLISIAKYNWMIHYTRCLISQENTTSKILHGISARCFFYTSKPKCQRSLV